MILAEVTGFTGEIVHDLSRPDGTPQKLLDTSRLTAMGWRPSIPLRDGIRQTYQWFLASAAS
jgi:GDP-L-fucose synthase